MLRWQEGDCDRHEAHRGAPPEGSLAAGFPPLEVITEMLRAATLAPSMHNAQPWRFRVSRASQTIELCADPSPMLKYSDPHARAVHIACGAALFNLRLAVAAAGREPVVRLFPSAGEPLLLAILRLAGPCRPGEADSELHTAIAARHTLASRSATRPCRQASSPNLPRPQPWKVRCCTSPTM